MTPLSYFLITNNEGYDETDNTTHMDGNFIASDHLPVVASFQVPRDHKRRRESNSGGSGNKRFVYGMP